MKTKLDIFNRKLILGIIVVLMITAVTSGVLLQPEYGNHNRQPLNIIAAVDNGRESLTMVKPSLIYVHATVYFPSVSQTDSTPYQTADMSKINRHHPEKHRWVALSPDLFKYFSYGDTIKIENCNLLYNGKWIVHDKMNARFKNRIDFLIRPGMYMISLDSVIIHKYTVKR